MSLGRSRDATEVDRPGVYRRRYIVETGPGWAAADLEDDNHCFGATVRHDGTVVTAVEARTVRTPWTLCVGGADLVQHLVGMRLEVDPRAVYAHTDAKAQCTHLFEVTGLAVAHAARPAPGRRQYDVDALVEDVKAPRHVTLRRDGEVLLAWTVQNHIVLDPAPFAGQDVRQMLAWAQGQFSDPDDYEAIVLMRRGVQMSDARVVSLDRAPTASFFTRAVGGCFVYQPGVMEKAVRRQGTGRDFTHTPDALLAHVTRRTDAAE